MRAQSWALVTILLGSATAEAREDLCYQGGPLAQRFRLLGTASVSGTELVVTPELASQVGGVIHTRSFAAAGDLRVRLEARLTSAARGDGMALVLSRDARGLGALGDGGEGLGYGWSGAPDGNQLTPSVAVELDTFQDTMDPDANHVALTRDGDPQSPLATFTPGFDLVGAGPVFVWLDYTAAATRLDVFVSQTTTRPATAQLTTTIDLAAVFANQPYFISVTASTVNGGARHAVASLLASDAAPLSQVCCTDAASCASSPVGRVCDPIEHVCTRCSAADVTACTQAPAGCDLGVAGHACVDGCSADFGVPVSGACPSLEAAVCRLTGPGLGSCVACNGDDTSGASVACPASAPRCSAAGQSCGVCTANADCGAQLCDVASGRCVACDGGFGQGTPRACPVATRPVCDGAGNCQACDGNAGAAGMALCSGATPYCAADGTCHSECLRDADCGAGAFCDNVTQSPSVCAPQVANGAAVPGGSCGGSPAVGPRACRSGSCDATDNVCGIGFGHGTCASSADCNAGMCILAGANAGRCLECVNPFTCGPLAQFCDLTSNRCVACLADNHCNGGVCLNNTCQECRTDTNCSATYFCQTNLCMPRAPVVTAPLSGDTTGPFPLFAGRSVADRIDISVAGVGPVATVAPGLLFSVRSTVRLDPGAHDATLIIRNSAGRVSPPTTVSFTSVAGMCTSDPMCPANLPSCSFEQCVRCTSSGHCPPPSQCQNNTCFLQPPILQTPSPGATLTMPPAVSGVWLGPPGPGPTIQVTLDGTPLTVSASSTFPGNISFSAMTPLSTPSGSHTLRAMATAGSGVTAVSSAPSPPVTFTLVSGTDDSDSDGIPDATELTIGTNRTDADSDDDGVLDGAEPMFAFDTDRDFVINALDPDSDGDGVLDGTEVGVATAPFATEVTRGNFRADDDPATRTGPILADSDNGGASDGVEDADHDGRIDAGERDPNLTADDYDADRDAVHDLEELALGTDPRDADSDDDGVSDGMEPMRGADLDDDGLANALDPDSDGDDLMDGTELGVTTPAPGTDVSRGNFMADADPSTRTQPLSPDTDHGGVFDGDEDLDHNGRVESGERDPNLAADDVDDADLDGLSDDAEAALGSSPGDADSDDDGVTDGLEAMPGADTDRDGLSNVLDFDSDGDGLSDGTELGLTAPGPDTDETQGHFVPDADPSTRTDPRNPDSDGDGKADGTEDADHNGRVDSGESDPSPLADGGVDGGSDAGGDGGCGCRAGARSNPRGGTLAWGLIVLLAAWCVCRRQQARARPRD